MQPRLIITRANGKCVIDTSVEEDKAIMITVVPAMPHTAFVTVGALNAALQQYMKDGCKGPAAPKGQGTTTGAGGYLDKEAVLKALHKVDYDVSCKEDRNDLIGRLLQGEFDAKFPPLFSERNALFIKLCEDHSHELVQREEQILLKSKEIARLKYQIAELKEEIEARMECEQEQAKAIDELMGRIAQQDQELKDLGKALQEAKRFLKGLGFDEEEKWPGEENIMKVPPKDEPELVICPKRNSGLECPSCKHSKPHSDCDKMFSFCCPLCIPVKKVQTVPGVQQPAPKLGDWDVQPHLSTLTTEILKIKDRLDALEKVQPK